MTHELVHEPSQPIPQDVATRVYQADLAPGHGRTVDIRIVPYGQRATCVDGLGGVPYGVPYEEEFLPGAFDHQLNAASRVKVLLDFEHQAGIAGVVGHGIGLASRDDGLHGSFRLHETQAGETALELVREGVLGAASIECRFLRSVRQGTGVVQRLKASLNRVALCREGAYADAVVLGVRTPPPPVLLDEELLPHEFDENLASRIAALGITLPTRLAHPAAGTPSAEGTPESTPAGSGNTTTEGDTA